MSKDIRIKVEPKTSPDLRKLARALLLLAEEQAATAKRAAEAQWANEVEPRQELASGEEPAA